MADLFLVRVRARVCVRTCVRSRACVAWWVLASVAVVGGGWAGRGGGGGAGRAGVVVVVAVVVALVGGPEIWSCAPCSVAFVADQSGPSCECTWSQC